MKKVYAAFHGTVVRRLHVRSFFGGIVVLFLAVFTLFQSGERVVKADKNGGQESLQIIRESDKTNIESSGNATTPLSAILNIDGTIKKGSIGSFDPKGFQMSYGPTGDLSFGV